MGDPASVISVGSLRAIYTGQPFEAPVLQCLQVKALASQANSQERYRCVWSDTKNFIQSMLGTQNNALVNSEKLRRGVLVRVPQYQLSDIKGKKILVALEVEVLEQYGEHEKIGNPETLEGIKDEGVSGFVKLADEQKPQPSTISGNNFYGNKTDNRQPAQSLPSRGGGSSAHGNIYPIESLSPYAHKWTIKARCINKSPIKTWHKATGEGKLFSVTFMDETGEIRGTAFNEQCDALFDIFQEGQVFYVSAPCRVQLAKKQFSNVNNDYELTFERDTVVEKAEEDAGVPQLRYNFTNLASLQTVESNSTVDTIGVIRDIGEVSQIVAKASGKPFDKREMTIVDSSGYSVRMTIWGDTAIKFDAQPEAVVAFKGVKVSDFGGRSLSLLASGSMAIDPDIDEAHKLRGWYDAKGQQEDFASHASVMGTTAGGGRKDAYKTCKAVVEEQLGMSDTAYFTLKATILFIKQEGLAYPACQSEGCNKKVVEINPGEWRCERCDKAFESPQYRYIMSANVGDHTGQIWVSCFDETGRSILGADATTMMSLQENDKAAFDDKVQKATCTTWVFRCRAKMDTFQDNTRIRYQASSVAPVDFVAESHRLAEMIQKYSIDDGQSLFVP